MATRRTTLKNQPEIKHRPDLDWTGTVARNLASGLTRRSVLCRLSYAAAAVLGVRFLVAGGARGSGTPGAKGHLPCFSESDKCNGILCGLQVSALLCEPLKACPGCLDNKTHCPQGTAPSDSWYLCCTCTNDNTKATQVIYTDCCGTPIDPHGPGPCGEKCAQIPENPGCKQPRAPCYLTGFGADWCTVGAGTYVCTTYRPTVPCTPGSGGNCK